jgi:hypothetical protein
MSKIVIDLKEMLWKDSETGSINKITEFKTYGDIPVVWYMNVDSLDEHCMDIDMFVSKHRAGGIFEDMIC